MPSSIPKPQLKDADETSLTLFWDAFEIPTDLFLRIQYKLPQEAWEVARMLNSGRSQTEVTVSADSPESEVADLEPGTPYFVRLVLIDKDENVKEAGPETVFDTAPINCTPKERKCVIS